MSRLRVTIVFAILMGAVAGASGVAWAAFTSTTSNGANSFSANSDARAPVIAATVVARADGGGSAGQVRQGTDYYLYANASDLGSPPTGVQTLTANVTSFDTGVTAAALSTSGGPWTVGATIYTYRSALLSADTPLTTGATYQYSLTTADAIGNTTTTTGLTLTVETYASVVAATPGLVSQWRLGETTNGVSDTFTDTAGVALQSHTGEVGATWTRQAVSDSNATITSAGRVRRTATGQAVFTASGAPTSPDYAVSGTIHVMSNLVNDGISVVGRANATGDTLYLARYIHNTVDVRWELWKFVSGSGNTMLGSSSEVLTAGSDYVLTLDMVGSTIRLLVDGAERLNVSDTAITATGLGGIRVGYSAATGVPTDSTGLHIDNVTVGNAVLPAADDLFGTNDGTYLNGATLSVADALAGDANTAVQFDGTNDYVAVSRQVQDNLSVEFWFKSTQGLNTSATWSGNAGLVDADAAGTADDFGVSLRSDGKITAGVGNPDTTVVSASGGYNDGGWHHVVFTRTASTGALTLYVDGASVGSGTGGTQSLNAATNISFGRNQTGALYFAGSLDEIAVYNTAVAAATVDDHFHSGRGF